MWRDEGDLSDLDDDLLMDLDEEELGSFIIQDRESTDNSRNNSDDESSSNGESSSDESVNLEELRDNQRAYGLRQRNREANQNVIEVSNYNESIIEVDNELTLPNSNSDSNTQDSNSTENTFSNSEIVGEPRQMANSQINSQPVIANSSQSTLRNSQQNQDLNDNLNDNNDNQPTNSNLEPVQVEQEATTSAVNLDESDDIETCLICCEPYHASNEHRMVSLKCGHIYGKECIERWLKTKESKRRCPKCNQTSTLKDIRVIYAKTVKCIDTTELDEARKQLEFEKRLRLTFEQKIEELKFDIGIKESENIQLKRQLNERDDFIKRFKATNQVATSLNQAKLNSLTRSSEPFTLLKKIDLNSEGCRLILVAEVLGYILISQPTSTNSLVKGYGIRRISINNLDSFSDFIYLHTANIKDMNLHPIDAILLTASFDKSVKLVNLISKQTMGTLTLESKPWCVSWNRIKTNLFYVGLNDGFILECSQCPNVILRKINAFVEGPVKLICFLNHTQTTNHVNLLITSVKSSFFGDFVSATQQELSHFNTDEVSLDTIKPLSISGSVISTSVVGDNKFGHILITVRPSPKFPRNVQHYVSLKNLSDFLN